MQRRRAAGDAAADDRDIDAKALGHGCTPTLASAAALPLSGAQFGLAGRGVARRNASSCRPCRRRPAWSRGTRPWGGPAALTARSATASAAVSLGAARAGARPRLDPAESPQPEIPPRRGRTSALDNDPCPLG